MENFFDDWLKNLKDVWQILVVFVSVPIVLSIILYCVEHDAECTKVKTWLDAMYLTWITLMTVGYGDISPVTGWGRLIVCIDAVFGVLLVGLIVPTMVRSSEKDGFYKRPTDNKNPIRNQQNVESL